MTVPVTRGARLGVVPPHSRFSVKAGAGGQLKGWEDGAFKAGGGQPSGHPACTPGCVSAVEPGKWRSGSQKTSHRLSASISRLGASSDSPAAHGALCPHQGRGMGRRPRVQTHGVTTGLGRVESRRASPEG